MRVLVHSVHAPAIPVRSIPPTSCSRSGWMQASDELEKLRSKIGKYEEQVDGITDPAERTAMRQEMAAMRQKEVLLMSQGEQA